MHELRAHMLAVSMGMIHGFCKTDLQVISDAVFQIGLIELEDQEHIAEASSTCPALTTASCILNLSLLLLQNNQHRLTLSMNPDDKYYEKQAQMEAEKLKQKVNSLSLKDKEQIYEKGQIIHCVLVIP